MPTQTNPGTRTQSLPLCDADTGLCRIPDADTAPEGQARGLAGDFARDITVHYVGDPMCSWCWGISPALKALESRCGSRGIGFEITLGGLRAGGGDPWNASFKDFLRSEWTHIRQVTGQPFGMSLLERGHFDYDTEPACRAVVAARLIAAQAGLPGTTALAFFSAVQRKFYVEGADPAQPGFYREICESLGMAFEAFSATFTAADTRRRTEEDFARCRRMGVNSFPSVLVETQGTLVLIGRGFVSPQQLLARLDSALVGG